MISATRRESSRDVHLAMKRLGANIPDFDRAAFKGVVEEIENALAGDDGGYEENDETNARRRSLKCSNVLVLCYKTSAPRTKISGLLFVNTTHSGSSNGSNPSSRVRNVVFSLCVSPNISSSPRSAASNSSSKDRTTRPRGLGADESSAPI